MRTIFEIYIVMKDGDWVDVQGVPDTQLCKLLSAWSSGEEKVLKIKHLHFQLDEIASIKVCR
ncbi:hypothetical protein MACH08_20160 [Oceanobacillus kimchii]|uniref:Uncharacterized protein n=1 Tax=Oceanobacillus kimchii TaxID=746691 RepID=A0ABQ5TJF1_9BACI|nr:hypothetical protein MACH08_20160 [Oceanobacillus kimchii]